MRTYYIDKEITDELATQVQMFVDDCERDTENKEEITFYINSNGGNPQAGMSIYDSIASLTSPTKAVILGMCASAATYPALACDIVEMKPRASFLIHPVSGGLYGTIEEIEKDLDYMVDIEGRMLAIYAAKTGLPLDEIKQLVAAGDYMDAQTTLNYGFVDLVEGMTREARAEEEESPQDTQESPADEEQGGEEAPADEEEEAPRGIVNKILTLAGVRRKGAIIHRPADDEADYQAEIANLKAAITAKDMQLDNMDKTLENKTAAFEAYREKQLADIESTKKTLENTLAALDDRVKREVHNHLAALGYDADSMPAPTETQNAAPVKLDETEKFLRELGLR